MSLLTETALFKACAEKPKTNLKTSDLYLDRVKDTSAAAQEGNDEAIALKKSVKLFHQAWSGVTKYIRTICNAKRKSVELSGIGIFVPMQEVNGQKTETKNLTSNALKEFRDEDNDIKLYIFKDFVEQANIKINQNSNKNLVEIYDPDSTMDEPPVFLLNASPINYNSIAKVCETDAYSITQIMQEIV